MKTRNPWNVAVTVPALALTLALGVLLALAGCTDSNTLTADIKTQAQANEKVKFGGYKTYYWFESDGAVDDQLGRWKETGLDIPAEVKFLIDRELRARGFTQVNEDPDLFVGFFVSATIDHFKQVERRGGKVPAVEGAGEGSVVIELIDADTEQTVWVGVAKGEAQTGRTAEEVRTRLEYIVTKLIEQLPRE